MILLPRRVAALRGALVTCTSGGAVAPEDEGAVVDGGAAAHDLTVDGTDTAVTARFTPAP